MVKIYWTMNKQIVSIASVILGLIAFILGIAGISTNNWRTGGEGFRNMIELRCCVHKTYVIAFQLTNHSDYGENVRITHVQIFMSDNTDLSMLMVSPVTILWCRMNSLAWDLFASGASLNGRAANACECSLHWVAGSDFPLSRSKPKEVRRRIARSWVRIPTELWFF